MIDSRAAPYAALLLRVSLGIMYIAHAWLKYAVFTLDGTAQFFGSVGLPGGIWFAGLMTGLELVGGIFLILGVYARWVALALLPLLAGAAWIHWPNGWLHTSPNGGWEYPVFLFSASVVLGFLGDGAWAPKLRPLPSLLGLKLASATR